MRADSASRRGRLARHFHQGLQAAVVGNAHAFGFSITVTVTFGVVSVTQAEPTVIDLLGFALAAVAAFSLLNILAVVLDRIVAEADEPRRAILIGTATDFVAVGLSVAAAAGVCALLDGWAAWLCAPFVAGLVYVLAQSVELMFGRRASDAVDD